MFPSVRAYTPKKDNEKNNTATTEGNELHVYTLGMYWLIQPTTYI